jgi:hypothetical protein
MAAPAAAAVAAAAMVGGGENHGGAFEVKVAGAGLGKRARFGGGKVGRDDAAAADAGGIAGIVGNAVEQLRREGFFRTPALAFVGIGAGELAFVGAAAKRTVAGLESHGSMAPVFPRNVTPPDAAE